MTDIYDTCNSFIVNCCNLVKPYKHVTVESVSQDTDIENQYERITKIVIVGSNNIFVNLLVHKIELIKFIYKHSKNYIQVMINKLYQKEDNIIIVEHDELNHNKKEQ